MPRFAANLTMLFTELPFLDRFGAAAQAGFKAVEFLFPYDYPAAEIRTRLDTHGLQLVLHNLPAGDWAKGERGIACLPGREAEFRAGVLQAVSYARAFGCPQLNCLVGLTPAGIDSAQIHQTLLANLRFAARELERAGLTLLVEAINTKDIPGFHLHRTAQVLALLDELGALNARVQFDIYHMHIMEGNVAQALASHLPRIAHLQLADSPGRHEPGTGEIDFGSLLPLIDRLGYGGWIGCEYRPKAGTVAGLGWLQSFGGPGA